VSIFIVILIAVFAIVFNYSRAMTLTTDEYKDLAGEQIYGASIFRVSQGGTGANTFTAGECLVGAGTGAITTTACGGGGGTTTVDSLILAEGYLIVGDASGYGSATSSLFIDAQGNIGIATATPAYTLDIYGDLRVTDSLTVTGQTTLAHASSTMLTVSGGIYGDLIGDVTGTASGNDVLGQATSTLLSHTTTYNHANYDTAYGWGDHSIAGYNLQSFASSTYAIAGGAFHDGFSDFVANEHLDWTASVGTIHADNYTDTTYVSSDFTHDSLTGVDANEHLDWTTDRGVTNIHSGNYTDTTYTGGNNLSLVGTTFNVDNVFLTNSLYYASTTPEHITSLPNQLLHPTFTWPGYATTTTATTTVPLGSAWSAETWTFAQCYTTSGTSGYQLTDGTNDMNYVVASTTVGRYALSTNNTFTAQEKRAIDIGPLTNAIITCTVEKTD